MKKVSFEKIGKVLDCLKALENRAINLDAPRMRLELPGRIRNILMRFSNGMNRNEIDALYANITAEYANSIIKSDFKDTLETSFWKTCEEQAYSTLGIPADIDLHTPAGYIQ